MATEPDGAADAEFRRQRALAARFNREGPASEAIAEWRAIVAFARSSFGADDGRTVTAQAALADWLASDHQLDEAITIFGEAVATARRLELWSPATAAIAAAFGRCLDHAERYLARFSHRISE